MSVKLDMFRNRLTKVIRHLGKQARRMKISCYRVYDHDLPEFPFAIEFYGENLYVAEYRRNHGLTEEEYEEWMDQSLGVISEVLEVPAERIFLKLRQRKAGRLGQYQKFDEQKHEFIVEENDLKFIVNLSDYLDTGLFLDHRITRQMVKNECAGKRMLNLFAYTGSFSVYAASGGASEVTTIDLSRTYLNWAMRNMELNGFVDPVKYKYVHADVKQYLRSIEKGTMDIIVMDPPTFSNSKRMDDFLDIQRDHVEMINQCLHALSPGGILYFSTNFRKFVLNRDLINSGEIKDITKATTPFDFESKLFRFCFKIIA
jgi:23S rRNA (cytosine1962-C5)-methyltransferase